MAMRIAIRKWEVREMSEKNKPRLRAVIIFSNGMVACTDTRGQQIPELQGPIDEMKAAIQEYAKDYWMDVEILK